jgi:hypothetical protein
MLAGLWDLITHASAFTYAQEFFKNRERKMAVLKTNEMFPQILRQNVDLFMKNNLYN